jgi:acyl carrier protein|tara:strand:- start:47 stop:274 length:228 start_codon:yes stop_codon:yes gene_type:complete
MNNSEKKFINIIKKNLSCSTKPKLSDEVKTFKKWDSLNNIRILLDLNKSFKKKINLSSIKNVKTLKDLLKYFTKI